MYKEGMKIPLLFLFIKTLSKMVAYKIWHDTKHYIHKDTTNEMNVQWTTDIADAKDIPHRGKGFTFFFDVLGFSLNPSKPDPLYTT